MGGETEKTKSKKDGEEVSEQIEAEGHKKGKGGGQDGSQEGNNHIRGFLNKVVKESHECKWSL